MEREVNIHRLHDDQVIGIRELAQFLNTTEAQLYKLNTTCPDRLPPRLVMFGRRLAWRMGACRQWLRSDQQPFAPSLPETGTTRKGRPRNG
jgi:predicted DNA-binding transcriptional regulator AlpA